MSSGMTSYYFVVGIAVLVLRLPPAWAAEPLRAGIVGCDTSHVTAFTELINDPSVAGPLARVEVTVAYPGGSRDIAASRDRVQGFVSALEKKGVKIVSSLDELADQCDVVMLESVDGRVHLEQFRKIARGKPVFIDKPMAASLADVLAIFQIADATNTPVYSASALRFCDSVQQLKSDKSIGKVVGCETAGPMSMEPHHPDLFWYGVHGVESLFTILGAGCDTVTRTDGAGTSLVIGKWRDGRLGSFRGIVNGKGAYSFTLFGEAGITQRAGFSGYGPSVNAMCEFFLSGDTPVNRQQTIEMFAFMEAADESERRGGEPVSIAEVIEQAKRRLTEIEQSAPASN